MSGHSGILAARTLGPAMVLLLALTGCGAADASDGGTATTATSAAAPAASSEPQAAPGSCGWRHVNLEEPIPGELFAQCVVDATVSAGTAQLSSTVAETTTAGPVTFRPPISGHLTVPSMGVEAIFIGERGWLLGPGSGGWVASDPNGTPAERMAHDTVSVYAAIADPEATRALVASAESWTPAGPATIDDRTVQGYRGTPVQEGVTHDSFSVWITDDDLPLRYEQSGTGYGGCPYTAQQDCTAYGEPVQIAAP